MSEGRTKTTKAKRFVKFSKSDKLTTEASTPAAMLLASAEQSKGVLLPSPAVSAQPSPYRLATSQSASFYRWNESTTTAIGSSAR